MKKQNKNVWVCVEDGIVQQLSFIQLEDACGYMSLNYNTIRTLKGNIRTVGNKTLYRTELQAGSKGKGDARRFSPEWKDYNKEHKKTGNTTQLTEEEHRMEQWRNNTAFDEDV